MKKWKPEKLIEFEEHVADLFKAGKVNCPVHLSGGNERKLIAIFDGIKDRDYVLSTHRNHYHYLLKGGDPAALLNEITGDKSGVCKGKGRSMHIYDPSINFYTSAIISGICAIAVGVGLALKKEFKEEKDRPHVWCFCGDGCEDSGHFIEAVRFGTCRVLPVTFVIEDNDLACDTTKAEQWHNFCPMQATNVIRYTYERRYPHVGISEHVSM